jgi:hypothetical protein
LSLGIELVGILAVEERPGNMNRAIGGDRQLDRLGRLGDDRCRRG